MKDNISKLKDCYGCGVCVKACPVKIINLRESKDGFYSPVIDEQDKCIECGLCLKVCAFNHKEVLQDSFQIKSYAGWSKDALVREWCSSGGVGFEIGKKLIEEDYHAVGVRYNVDKVRAEHFIASTEKEFMPSVGSKYIPSFTEDAFKAIDKNHKYLVTGTPCQIDSFRRYIRQFKIEDNFLLLDFFCHGVPSLLLWDKYLDGIKDKIGEIEFASWRNKSTGWHDSWSMNADGHQCGDKVAWQESYNLKIKEKKHFYSSKRSDGDLFYKFFLGNYCLNKCCYSTCKYKMTNSAADIRIGDLWGKKYASNQEGVSAVLAFTKRGEQILNNLQSECTFIPDTLNVVTEGQMKQNASRPFVRDLVVYALKTPYSLNTINDVIIKGYNILKLPYRIVKKLSRILKAGK